MEPFEGTIKLYYNTEREKMAMPEYGRNVLRMVEIMKKEPDRAVRSTMARAIVGVMETLNPSVRQQDNYSQKLWDHLYIIAGYDLDIDSPYPAPVREDRESRPMTIPLKKKPVKATHYGRNIESIIDLIALEPEGETRTSMIRALATYMRQQYLIWNKDSVADETIFSDIEKLSEGRIRVPDGLTLSKISSDMSYSRPGLNLNMGRGKGQQKKNRKNRNKQ
ncbi:MAG: DUF4290 domain-containing protein [Bacteroidales bacterium]|nr:DUF4290 domain-containing protein [Bacteroidales bacterium]MBQ4305893.1 DUF4290 domain-containing protein [Bacteroidales bacterium]MBQ5944431.1 DUF4290 domain-containing protein [Bacteroidales bacterium]